MKNEATKNHINDEIDKKNDTTEEPITVYITERSDFADSRLAESTNEADFQYIEGEKWGGVYTAQEDPNREIPLYYFSRLNEIIKNQNFSIVFQPTTWVKELDQNSYRNAEFRYAQNLAKGNTVYINLHVPYVNAEIPQSVDDFIIENQYAHKIDTELWKAYAPQWYDAMKHFIDENPYAIPVGGIYPRDDRSVLVVFNQINQAYGKEIDTLNDYEDFLLWARDIYPDKVPSLISVQVNKDLSSGYNDELLNLICPELGYVPIDTVIGQRLGFVASIAGDSEELSYIPFEQIPSFANTLKRVLTWRDNELCELASISNELILDDKKSEKYCSYVLDAGYWQKPTFSMKFYALNVKPNLMLQPVHVLYDGVLPNTYAKTELMPCSVSYVGAQASDLTLIDWLRFVEWLHKDKNNYQTIAWGKFGTDYTIEDGQYKGAIIPFEVGGGVYQRVYRSLSQASYHFRDDRYTKGSIQAYESDAMNEALSLLIYVDSPAVSPLQDNENVSAAFSQFAESDPQKILSRRQADVQAFFKRIVTMNTNQVDEEVNRFIESQKGYAKTISSLLQQIASEQS